MNDTLNDTGKIAWPKKLLGEFAEFRNGLNYTKDNEGGGLKVINVKDFGDRLFPDYDTLGELNPAGMNLEEALLSNGDILFVRSNGNRALVGRTLLICDPPPNVSYSGFSIRMRLTNPSMRSRFCAYFFRSPLFRKALSQLGSGTNISNLSQPMLRSLVMPTPSLKAQDSIVDFISAYDDLIENNRRRIQLLEQSARLLYKEWFVHLRFPGHQHSPVGHKFAAGWEQKKLGDVLTLKRGYDLPTEMRRDGDISVVSSSGITGYHSEKKADAPGVVTGRYGTLGEVYFINQAYWPLNTALYVSDFKGHSPLFVLHLLKHELSNIQSDKAAIPGLNRNVLHERSIVYPPKTLRDDFTDFAGSCSRQICILDVSNVKLRAARDLLLPRLMSGELVA